MVTRTVCGEDGEKVKVQRVSDIVEVLCAGLGEGGSVDDPTFAVVEW